MKRVGVTKKQKQKKKESKYFFTELWWTEIFSVSRVSCELLTQMQIFSRVGGSAQSDI